MDMVKTVNGDISGKIKGEAGKFMHEYRGIPYAKSPIGDLRWKPPEPVTSWLGVRECTIYSLQAPQYPDVNVPTAQRIPCSEDCLYLNVLTPAEKPTDKLPVMVWFHGGGLRYGNGNWSLYNGPGLPQHGVVLVTVNSRLGVMGLMTHPALSQESPQGVSGNYLFLDLIAALQWVKKNIAGFGGDPDNVTIFGESGGGTKVISLMASPLAKGLFHKAICQSGGATVRPMTLREMEDYGKKLFTKLGVDNSSNPLAAARKLSWEKVIEIDQAMNVELGQPFVFMGPWNIAVDGWFMPDSPDKIFKAGKQNAVPLITLANLGELSGTGLIVASRMIPGYVNLLIGQNKAGVKGYAGIFDQVPANWRQEGGTSSHAMELHYVFGAVNDSAPWRVLRFLYRAGGAKSPEPIIGDTDRQVSESMMKIWTHFAKTGYPDVESLVHWPPYAENTDLYLYITEPLQVKSGFSRVAQ